MGVCFCSLVDALGQAVMCACVLCWLMAITPVDRPAKQRGWIVHRSRISTTLSLAAQHNNNPINAPLVRQLDIADLDPVEAIGIAPTTCHTSYNTTHNTTSQYTNVFLFYTAH